VLECADEHRCEGGAGAKAHLPVSAATTGIPAPDARDAVRPAAVVYPVPDSVAHHHTLADSECDISPARIVCTELSPGGLRRSPHRLLSEVLVNGGVRGSTTLTHGLESESATGVREMVDQRCGQASA
jgi:hypothetical protein